MLAFGWVLASVSIHLHAIPEGARHFYRPSRKCAWMWINEHEQDGYGSCDGIWVLQPGLAKLTWPLQPAVSGDLASRHGRTSIRRADVLQSWKTPSSGLSDSSQLCEITTILDLWVRTGWIWDDWQGNSTLLTYCIISIGSTIPYNSQKIYCCLSVNKEKAK